MAQRLCRALPLGQRQPQGMFAVGRQERGDKKNVSARVKAFFFACTCLWSVCYPRASAQAGDPAGACASPELILGRYIGAVGGEDAIRQLQTRVADATETEPYSFKPQDTATYKYRFEWKTPNKVVSRSTHVVPMFLAAVPFAKPRFVFDGERWSDFQGKSSQLRNEASVSQRPVFPNPFHAMLSVGADPLMVARGELYSGFTLANDFTLYPGQCVLEAQGIDGRADLLYFDATTGLLKTWKLQIYHPRHSAYVVFRFDDYRQAGDVKFPFYLYCDFYKAEFRYTKVIHNRPLPAKRFVIQER
jgi:hypothetical protein